MQVFRIAYYFVKHRVFHPVILAIVTALFQAASVASVEPFLTLVTNPEKFKESIFARTFNSLLIGFSNIELVVFFGSLFVSLTILTSVILLLSTHASSSLVWEIGHGVRKMAFEKYLSQDIDFYANDNSSAGMKLIVSDTANFTTDVLAPSIELASGVVKAIVLIGIMLIISFHVTLLLGFLVVSLYFLIFVFSDKYTKKLSNTVADGFELLYSEVKESIDNISYVKFSDTENAHVARFSTVSDRMRKVEPKLVTLSLLPRNLFEGLAVLGIVFTAIISLKVSDSSVNHIPIFGVLLFGTYRLMPVCQQIYVSAIRIKSYRYSLDIVHHVVFGNDVSLGNLDNVRRMRFRDSIKFSNISFRRDGELSVLKDINFSISKGQHIGIFGSSGSGKSTLIKLFTMLYEPVDGEIQVDGEKLQPQDAASWRKSIGYVPQDVYLKFGSIAENVAFVDGPIDLARVRACCDTAELTEFIESGLPDGFATVTGDGDSRFSGGQRQRIGIARALYREPDILVLDESTSALDRNTEMKVLRNLRDSGLTIMSITHNLFALKDADQVFQISNGQLEVMETE